MAEDRLSGAMQENLLTLLCFDKEAAPIIHNMVEVGLYSTDVFRDIAYEAGTFYETFGVPVEGHLPDLFEDILEGANTRRATLYRQVLRNLYASKDAINKEYVLSSMSKFIKEQTFSRAITEAAKNLRSGNLELAEQGVLQALHNQEVGVFDPGMFLSESADRIITHLRTESEFLSLGIPPFDAAKVGPGPKELFTVLAPFSRGKTWFLIHIGKRALLQRKNVLHVTLEMSEEKTMTRYYQSLLSIARRKARNKVPEFKVSKNGRFDGLEFRIVNRPTFRNKRLPKLIQAKLPSVLKRYRLLVKQFPTGSLTIKQLESYLDLLERHHNFIPDVLLVDYADLMHMDSSQLRIETGQVFKSLRGLSVARNLYGVTASQANRSAEEARWVTGKHLAEDYSKAATSDIMVSINQTDLEKSMRLARLLAVKNRDEEDGVTALISQGLSYGQFVTDSVALAHADVDSYWDELEDEPDVV